MMLNSVEHHTTKQSIIEAELVYNRPCRTLFICSGVTDTGIYILALLAESQQSLCGGVVSVVRPSVCPSVSLFLVYAIKSTFWSDFRETEHNSLSRIDLKKKSDNQ